MKQYLHQWKDDYPALNVYDSEWAEKVLAHHKKQRMETSQQFKTSIKWKMIRGISCSPQVNGVLLSPIGKKCCRERVFWVVEKVTLD